MIMDFRVGKGVFGWMDGWLALVFDVANKIRNSDVGMKGKNHRKLVAFRLLRI
jgi:hypothetical protein